MKTKKSHYLKIAFSFKNKQQCKNTCLIPAILFLLCTINSHAQYVKIGKGKDSEGIKRVVKDNGITNEFHKNHNKEIVFIKKPLSNDEIKDEDIVTTYNYGEPLYFRVYLTRSLVNEVSLYIPSIDVWTDNTSYILEMTLDGKYSTRVRLNDSFEKKEEESWTTWKAEFYHDKNNKDSFMDAGFSEFILEHAQHLTIGEHEIEFKLFPRDGDYKTDRLEGKDVKPMASSVLKINFSKKLTDPDNPDICLPEGITSDKVLEEAMITAFKDRGWTQTPLKARITGEFYIVRNKYSGIVERKVIHGVVGYKGEEGCKYQTYSFAKEHDGSGFNGKLRLHGINSTYRIPCDCLESDN